MTDKDNYPVINLVKNVSTVIEDYGWSVDRFKEAERERNCRSTIQDSSSG